MTVQLQGITHVFSAAGGSVTALRDVSARIEDGQFVSLVGPSGCGKSTMLRIVAGLITTTEGSVTRDGQLIHSPLANAGFVFQKPVLFPWRTVLANVMFPYEMRAQQDRSLKPRRKEFLDRAHSLLEMAGLSGFDRAYPKELSGGMAQRVAICRALLLDPEVLLMDEPFGALDEFTRDRLNVELLQIWESSRKTVFFVTHHIPEAVFLSDRVLVFSPHPGELLADITVDLPRPRVPAVRETVGFLDETVRVRRQLKLDEADVSSGAAGNA
jgi:NitT/TauT family transport system ATP-binding protein